MTDFIQRIKVLGKLPVECYLVTLDVSSLYTNIDIDEGLTRTYKNEPGQAIASNFVMSSWKGFEIEQLHFQWRTFYPDQGDSNGNQSCTQILIRKCLHGKIRRKLCIQNRVVQLRYNLGTVHIDSLTEFIDHLNNTAPSIKVTHEISTNSVNFLDTTVLKDRQGNIGTHVYQKPADTHPYLWHWNSAHPPHLKQWILYSQALRLKRICSSTDTLKKPIAEYADLFVACGYQRTKVLREMEKVLTMTQEECLQTRERESTDRIPLVTTFNPHTTFIAEIARRNWNFLQSKERLAHIFNKPPLVAYRRPISPRDRLVSTKFKTVNNTPVSFAFQTRSRLSFNKDFPQHFNDTTCPIRLNEIRKVLFFEDIFHGLVVS